MRMLPDDLREQLASLRVCQANGVSPRVLVPERALEWLEHVDLRGGSVEHVDDPRERTLAFGRRFLDAPYDRDANALAAPDRFSCSSFVKYALASVGIWMPRYAIDQSYRGRRLDGMAWEPGTLVCWPGEFPIRDPGRPVGHIGLACDDRRALHAGGRKRTVHEFTPRRPETAVYADPFPAGPSVLIHAPRGFETALDLVRSLQR